MSGQVEKRRGPRLHKKTFRFLIQLSLCCQRHVVLEGVENMGSTGWIRAISLVLAQNWSGRLYGEAESSVGLEMAGSAAAAFASLCLCVLSRFFIMSGCFPWQDTAKRIMGKGNINAVLYFYSSWSFQIKSKITLPNQRKSSKLSNVK